LKLSKNSTKHTQFLKSKTITAIALFLTLTIAITLVALPATNAQSSGQMASYAFIHAEPNPVGVGQTTYIAMWVDTPLADASIYNDIRRHGYKLTITKPGGSTEVKEWSYIDDSTGAQYIAFIPDQVGTYTLKFDYAGQVYTWNASAMQRRWTGITFLPSATTTTLIVQEEPLPAPITSYPMPTEYWTRPIEGENIDWWTVSSHWLGGNYLGTFQTPGDRFNIWQRDGTAPNSPHILWTRPIEFGGVVGGSNTGINASTYYSGGSYEGRFNNALIINGILYYTVPLGHSGSGGGYQALDLRTGEEIWRLEDIGGLTGTSYYTAFNKGQLLAYNTQNQHGVVGGMLWRVDGTTWNAYDAFTGRWIYNLTAVPSGTEVYTETGGIVRYVLNYPRRWLALWNSTYAEAGLGQGVVGIDYLAEFGWRPSGKVVNMSGAYSWNVTIPNLPGASTPAIVAILPGDIILGRSFNPTTGTLTGDTRGTSNPYTLWALSDKPTTRGQLLWIRNYTAPSGNITRLFGPVDPVNRVWTMTDAETMEWLGYNIDTGDLLWGPTKAETRAIQFFSSGSGAGQRAVTAYGNIYVQGFGGELFAYSAKNGSLLWKFNNTYDGLQTPWGYRPIFIAAVADGKVYAFNNEHSPNAPLYRGNKIYAIDAYTGEEIYRMLSWAGQVGGHGVSTSVLADGVLAYYNYYDNSIYAIGKGPSATTVEAPMTAVTSGSSLVIRGTVTDIAAGTRQKEQVARFPNGVPAVSDESQSAWMEYVYMQKPKPTDATGVPVKIDVIDANGNNRNIGTAVSDSSGMFTLAWKPDIEGAYTVIATFTGSESYWPSYAETSFFVDPAPTPPAEGPQQLPSMTDTYVLYAAVAIVIAIAAGFAVVIVLLRKRP